MRGHRPHRYLPLQADNHGRTDGGAWRAGNRAGRKHHPHPEGTGRTADPYQPQHAPGDRSCATGSWCSAAAGSCANLNKNGYRWPGRGGLYHRRQRPALNTMVLHDRNRPCDTRALIVGGTQGLGLAIAERLSARLHPYGDRGPRRHAGQGRRRGGRRDLHAGRSGGYRSRASTGRSGGGADGPHQRTGQCRRADRSRVDP